MAGRRALPLVLLAIACGPRAPATDGPTDPALRERILAAVERDQAVRDTFAQQLRATGTLTPGLVASMRYVDSLNLAWIEPQFRSGGLPTRSQVGKDAVIAAALLVQHADADPAFQAEMLPRLDSAYRAGDINGQEVAMLTDRVAKAQGRPQRYGTQTTGRDGRLVIDPIEDSAGVDARRAAMGLPSLAEYKHLLDSMYAHRAAP
jgi:hypothetical protein